MDCRAVSSPAGRKRWVDAGAIDFPVSSGTMIFDRAILATSSVTTWEQCVATSALAAVWRKGMKPSPLPNRSTGKTSPQDRDCVLKSRSTDSPAAGRGHVNARHDCCFARSPGSRRCAVIRTASRRKETKMSHFTRFIRSIVSLSRRIVAVCSLSRTARACGPRRVRGRGPHAAGDVLRRPARQQHLRDCRAPVLARPTGGQGTPDRHPRRHLQPQVLGRRRARRPQVLVRPVHGVPRVRGAGPGQPGRRCQQQGRTATS